MSDVWEDEKGQEFVQDLCHALGAVFATVFLLGPGGNEIANATTIDEEGYNPCWNTTRRFAHGGRGGNVLGWLSVFHNDHVREGVETPKADGAALQLLSGGKVVGVVGILGVSPAEAIVAVEEIIANYDLTITARPS